MNHTTLANHSLCAHNLICHAKLFLFLLMYTRLSRSRTYRTVQQHTLQRSHLVPAFLPSALLGKCNKHTLGYFPCYSYCVNFVEFDYVPDLCLFSGVEDISRCAFEHISHSLMGGHLSHELVPTGRGLRSGALLITGAKVSFRFSFKLRRAS